MKSHPIIVMDNSIVCVKCGRQRPGGYTKFKLTELFLCHKDRWGNSTRYCHVRSLLYDVK